jgi:hypothetical protein
LVEAREHLIHINATRVKALTVVFGSEGKSSGAINLSRAALIELSLLVAPSWPPFLVNPRHGFWKVRPYCGAWLSGGFRIGCGVADKKGSSGGHPWG